MTPLRATKVVAVWIITLASVASSQAAMNVGLATSMDKIMIRGVHNSWPLEGWTDDHYDLFLAQNEHEAFQVIVWSDQALSDVNVSVSPLQGQGGTDEGEDYKDDPVGHHRAPAPQVGHAPVAVV